MAHYKVAVENGNNILVTVDPSVSNVNVVLDRGVSGVGIENIETVFISPDYFLKFYYTNGTNENVLLPATEATVLSFNTRIGVVTLNSADVTSALGYTPPTPTGTGATGTWGISVTGTASNITGTVAVANGGTGASDAATARTNLGVTATGADTTYAFRANNLSDLASAITSRTNLGLGTISTQNAATVAITGGSISGITDLAVADGGTGASNATDARTNLGLGTIATQDASAVAITGGAITGITDLAVADGGTGASNATDARTNLGVTATGADTTYAFRANNLSDLASATTARTNLGLGTIATQNANAVAVTGGSVNGTAVGNSTASTGAFTTLGATGTSTLAAVNSGALAVTGAITANSAAATAPFIASINGGEKMRIDSAGNVGIGTSSPGAYKLNVAGNVNVTGASTLAAVTAVGRVEISGGSGDRIFEVTGTSATTGTTQFGEVFNPTFGAAVTTLYGRYISFTSNGATGTNAYSMYVESLGGTSTFTNRWGLYLAGTDKNHLNGPVTMGNGLAVTGAISCTGALSKGSGSFRIEHPLPAKSPTHQLVHSFIEGPKADLIYRGKVALVAGQATVNIDTAATMTEGTFEVLCRDVQCFTTNESDWVCVRGKVIGNILTIEAEDITATSVVSWMVIGERQDPHMMETEWTDAEGRVIVEPLKPVELETAP